MLNSAITPIYVQKLNANDDSYLLAELLINNGTYVKQDERIALLETSKTVFELVSPKDGYIYFNALITGSQVAPSNLLAVVLSSNNYSEVELKDIFRNLDQKNVSERIISTYETRFSKKALELIEKHKLDPKAFFGKSVVREKDVLSYLGL